MSWPVNSMAENIISTIFWKKPWRRPIFSLPCPGKANGSLLLRLRLRMRNTRSFGAVEIIEDVSELHKKARQFDIMERVSRAEWDTLLFFYGVILCVGGLSQFGYLGLLSHSMYTNFSFTFANVLVGIVSAVVDNIPIMFAVLTMNPDMSVSQWQLVTLTTEVGGSLLSIGSAAGVALMGTARGTYTFGAHLKWTPVIALGYAAGILFHLLIN